MDGPRKGTRAGVEQGTLLCYGHMELGTQKYSTVQNTAVYSRDVLEKGPILVHTCAHSGPRQTIPNLWVTVTGSIASQKACSVPLRQLISQDIWLLSPVTGR